MSRSLLFSISATALIWASALSATETVTYSYDAQGRLIQSVISGTVNNGQSSSTTFDAANNRTNYSVSLSGGTPPPASNQPPVPVAGIIISAACDTERTVNILQNATDPDGDLPLSFEITGGSGASLVTKSGLQSVYFYAPFTRNATYSVSYVVTDARGATAAASLTLRVTGTVAQCGGGSGPPLQRETPPPVDAQKPTGGG